MRLLRTLVPVACVLALVVVARPLSSLVAVAKAPASGPVALPGPMDILYAAPGDANYSYGPSHTQRAALMASVAPTATFTVTYTGFDPTSEAAFQAAVDIWSHIIVSPVPIRVSATFSPLSAGQLGSAGPTQICSGTVANTFYAAALADKLHGSAFCAALGGQTAEIGATFNSTFSSWDFGTSGTGVAGKYNFMTVVLHELGHGLGFYGSATSSSGVGSLGYGSQGFPGVFDIFDRFIQNGSGTPLINFTSPSTALHGQLTSNSLFFNGTNTDANNSGSSAKIESHNFNTAYNVSSADNGWLQGSSYSHTDDVLYSLTPNGLMTWQLAANEVYTDPGPIVRGIFQDEGWTLAAAGCTYSISPASVSVGAAATTGSVSLTTQTGCTWTASSGNISIASITSAASGIGSATVSYSVTANTAASQRSVTLTIGTQIFSITQNGTGPTMSLDRTSLIFAGVTNGASLLSKTGTQTVRLTQSGTGTVTWTASSNQPWLVVSPTSGSGSATLSLSVQFASGLSATQAGSVTLSFTGAGNSAGPISVTLNTINNGLSTAPVGSFDTPTDGSMGVAGSIGVTGWAMDDVAVTGVTICRDAVTGETAPVDARCNGLAKIFIGNAVFIDGARPDVQALYPNSPLNTRAGWGYLMLTNFLPATGNGTFTLYAYAGDADGHTSLLGTKTITCANNSSIAPFGAIDTPGQGALVSGSVANFGWVLSPGTRRADPPGGGIVTVQVDGTNLGSPGAWGSRPDLSALFPASQYAGINTALGVFGLDTTTLTNGVHSIAWIVTATSGGTSGVGSRFFSVSNGSLMLDPTGGSVESTPNVIASPAVLEMPRAAALRVTGPASLAAEIDAAPADFATLEGRRGFDLTAPLRDYTAARGQITVQAEELDRVELHLSATDGHRYTGYLRTPDGVAPLPIGSTLDASTGSFGWMPGPGFVGTYNLVFVRWSGGTAVARQDVQVVLNPKGSNRVGTQTIIDLPAQAGSYGSLVVGQPFAVTGWAADLDSLDDRGVDTVHVWAYPVAGSGRPGLQHDDPIFIGAATYGGARPDVAAIYGDRFKDTGYGIIVRGLVPGTYDLAVFAYSTVTGSFAPAKVVRVTVR